MANLFGPRCGIPTFVQTDKKVVGECGVYSGYFMAGILTVFIIFFAIGIYSSSSTTTTLTAAESEQIKKKRNAKLFFLCLCTVLVWVLIPRMFRFFSLNSWETYQGQISQYMAQGLSRKDAIKRIQSLYQTQLQDSAIVEAGAEIASANS